MIVSTGGRAPTADDLREIVRQFPSFIAVYEGEELRCVVANDAALAIVDGREFVGLPLRQALPEFESQQIVDMIERVFATGQPGTATEWRVQLRHPDLPEPVEVFANFAASPWRNPDGTLRGVITTGSLVTDMVRARQAADDRAAVTEQRYARARADVAELQRALLPPGVPVLPRTVVSARYLVAASEQAAGGDWFDAIPVDDVHVALVVGDVVGHGIEASAAMGQLRAVLLELLESGLPLEEVVLRLDVFATRHRALRATTVCIAVLDQHTGALRYVTLGHPPPLLLAGDGGRYLDPTGGAPLGTGGPGVAETGAANVAPGETLVLFTDGLIERPGRSLADGSEELLRVASAAAGNQVLPAGAPRSAAERISEQAVEVLTRSGYLDDVTVLAAERRAEPVAALHLDLAAEPSRLGTARGEVARWLTTLGADGDTIYEMQLAVSEALANAIEHAHTDDGGEGRVRLDVALLPSGRLQCCITDDGHWSEPTLSEPTRGRGLALIRAVSDDLTIRRGLPGTEVTFERRLARPAAVTSATATGGPPMDEASFHIEQSTGDTGAVVTVSGPIDLVTVERFTAAVLAAARGGAAAVTVDLAGVTHLASAGVRALYEVGHAGGSLRLWSPPGTPARLVIELVGLADLVLDSADSA